jgi:hypothetical protein
MKLSEFLFPAKEGKIKIQKNIHVPKYQDDCKGESLEVRSTLIFPGEENQLPFSLRSSLLYFERLLRRFAPRNARSGFIGDSSPLNPHPYPRMRDASIQR